MLDIERDWSLDGWPVFASGWRLGLSSNWTYIEPAVLSRVEVRMDRSVMPLDILRANGNSFIEYVDFLIVTQLARSGTRKGGVVWWQGVLSPLAERVREKLECRKHSPHFHYFWIPVCTGMARWNDDILVYLPVE